MRIQSKLPAQGTTIFTVMSQLASEHQAINLGQGFPDFPMSEKLIDYVNMAMRDGFNQYTHMNGYPKLREAISEKVFKCYGTTIHPETEITITPGATYAIYTALSTIVNPGDEIIYFEPAYDSYVPGIRLNGGIPIAIPLNEDNYSVDWNLVEQKITPRTKAIIINSPHNPSGAVLSEQDIASLTGIINKHDLFIISDEVYEHLIFDDRKHLSVLRYPSLYERSFVCFSFGKTYHCTGWKIGYTIAPISLSAEFRKIHQFNAFCVDTPKQVALANYLENDSSYNELGIDIQRKRDFFAALMAETPFSRIPSFGSYFECYRYEKISDMNDQLFAKKLVQDYGVACIPVSAFYSTAAQKNTLRFCFAKKEETLALAVQRLKKISHEL